VSAQPSRGTAPTEARGSRNSLLSIVVRKRPMNRREIQSQQSDVVMCKNSAVIVREPKLKVDLTRYTEEHNFLFDQSFDEHTTNEQLYCSCVRPVIDAVFQRAKCTCFAYGQTGSGKTFTMMGPNKKQCENLPERDRVPGIFLLASKDIFRSLAREEYSHLSVYLAFYEIYCGKLFDLLNNRQLLHARENAKSNVVIVGLQEHPVQNVQELMEVIEFGLVSRTTGVTAANLDSSRSHAILQISLKDTRVKDNGCGQKQAPVEHGKISFIDLAGSERGADTMDTDRQTRMDGAEINKSLLALKECIRAMDQQLDHTPFRGSKLTQVLKDSFVGSNCRTVMIANVSPCSSAVEHSLNTLRYAYRVKELRSGSKPPDKSGESAGMPEYQQSGAGQADMAIEEEDARNEEQMSADDGLEPAGDETPPNVQQQMRVNNLSAAAQSLASPREDSGHQGARLSQNSGFHGSRGEDDGTTAGRLFESRSGSLRAHPEEAGTASRHSPLGGSDNLHTRPTSPSGTGIPSNGLGLSASTGGGGMGQPAPEVCRVEVHGSDLGAQAAARLAGRRGGLPQQAAPSEQTTDHLAPEVALEPVGSGCSQAALDELARQHDRLIGTILAEEEELITSHRQHIDMMVELIKEEMVHLNNVDRPGSDVDAYVAGLDRILRLKAQYIGDIRSRVDLFKEHLQQEDTLSRKFQSLASSSS